MPYKLSTMLNNAYDVRHFFLLRRLVREIFIEVENTSEDEEVHDDSKLEIRIFYLMLIDQL